MEDDGANLEHHQLFLNDAHQIGQITHGHACYDCLVILLSFDKGVDEVLFAFFCYLMLVDERFDRE